MSLALDQVSISLGGRLLVKGVSLQLPPGEIVGLLGPNGAGKTTTFNLVIGLLRPDAGQVLLDDRDVASLSMPQRAVWRVLTSNQVCFATSRFGTI